MKSMYIPQVRTFVHRVVDSVPVWERMSDWTLCGVVLVAYAVWMWAIW